MPNIVPFRESDNDGWVVSAVVHGEGKPCASSFQRSLRKLMWRLSPAIMASDDAMSGEGVNDAVFESPLHGATSRLANAWESVGRIAERVWSFVGSLPAQSHN